MTIISDLSFDLVEEILSRVPLTCLGRVRSTCKRWNALSKDESFTKKHCGTMVNMCWGYRALRRRYKSMIFSLHNMKDLSSIKEIGKILPPLKILEVYPCDGLLLCVVESSGLVVWNPYLAQTRWIDVEHGDRELCTYALGYDNNNNHKVLRSFYKEDEPLVVKHDIYDFKSYSWRVLNITKNSYLVPRSCHSGVSLKGNTYFVDKDFVICFDFTTERIGPCFCLPFQSAFQENVVLSCVREEQLAVLRQKAHRRELEIWITTKIEDNAVSWTQFLKVDMETLVGSSSACFDAKSFFLDKKKKVAVICGSTIFYGTMDSYNTCYVVGEDGYYKEIDLGDVSGVFSYDPNPVPIQL